MFNFLKELLVDEIQIFWAWFWEAKICRCCIFSPCLFLELVGCKNKKIPKVNSHFAQILKRAACWWNSNFPSHIIPSQEMAVDGMQRSQITHLLAPGGEICGLEILLEDICPKFYTASKLLKLLMSSYGLNLIWEITNIYETIFTSGDKSPLKTQISRIFPYMPPFSMCVCCPLLIHEASTDHFCQLMHHLLGWRTTNKTPLRKPVLLGYFFPRPMGTFLFKGPPWLGNIWKKSYATCMLKDFPGWFKLFLALS